MLRARCLLVHPVTLPCLAKVTTSGFFQFSDADVLVICLWDPLLVFWRFCLRLHLISQDYIYAYSFCCTLSSLLLFFLIAPMKAVCRCINIKYQKTVLLVEHACIWWALLGGLHGNRFMLELKNKTARLVLNRDKWNICILGNLDAGKVALFLSPLTSDTVI